MELKINDEKVAISYDYEDNGFLLRGSAKTKTDNSVVEFSVQVLKKDGDEESYLGDANGWMNGGELKTTIQGVRTAYLSDVALVIENMVSAIGARG